MTVETSPEGKLLELAAKCCMAASDEQGALLSDAWDLIAPVKGIAWARGYAGTFASMVDAGAFESAALLLIPGDQWGYQMMPQFGVVRHPDQREKDAEAHGRTPALAFTAACLRARAHTTKGTDDV